MWYLSLLVFSDKEFKFQLDGCSGCHGVLMMSVNLNDNAILNIWGVDCCIINGITKSGLLNLLQKTYLKEKTGPLWNIEIKNG